MFEFLSQKKVLLRKTADWLKGDLANPNVIIFYCTPHSSTCNTARITSHSRVTSVINMKMRSYSPYNAGSRYPESLGIYSTFNFFLKPKKKVYEIDTFVWTLSSPSTVNEWLKTWGLETNELNFSFIGPGQPTSLIYWMWP